MSRTQFPLIVGCKRLGFGVCTGHDDCREAFWARYDAHLARMLVRGEPAAPKSRRAS